MPGIAPPPPPTHAVLDTLICEAIRGRKLMMYEYGGLIRVVEPHRFGESAAGDRLLSGWLRPGYSRSDPNGGWRTWRVDRIGSEQILDYQFDGPRPGYNPAEHAPDDEPPDAIEPAEPGGV